MILLQNVRCQLAPLTIRCQVYDRVWDFTITIVLLHIIISVAVTGGETKGEWWACVGGGGVILGGLGYFLSDYYWGMIAQERLTGKMDVVNK